MVKFLGSLLAAGIVCLLLIAAVLVPPPEQAPAPGYGAPLKPGTVPEAYVAFVEEAAQVCPGIDGPLLAAQIDAESEWDPDAVSGAGAEGLAQFMPDAWAEWGRDADGNGVAVPTDPHDAIAAQADYMCWLYDQTGARIEAGTVTGQPVELALAGYNAGLGAVEDAAGIPINGQTELYVHKVLQLRLTYAGGDSGGGGGVGTIPEGYDPSPTECPPTGSDKEGNLQPGALRGARCAVAAFSFVTLNSGWRSSGSVRSSDHPFGNAVDFGPDDWASEQGNRRGWYLAHWFQVNADRLNVKYVIWDNWTWNPAKRPDAWVPYYHASDRNDPSSRHEDHVHVSFNGPGGDDNAPLINHSPPVGTTPRAEFRDPASVLP